MRRLRHLALATVAFTALTLLAPATGDDHTRTQTGHNAATAVGAATLDAGNTAVAGNAAAALTALDSHSAASTAIVLNAQEPLTRFTFGSCNKHSKPQPMWPHMIARQPQMFLWLGDVVYADENLSRSYIDRTREFFRAQYAQENYTALRDSVEHVLGIYDDHDYGVNDGDATYVDKEAARHLFLDFLEEPADSPRRYRDGIYQDYIWGPIGQRVKFILLDNRYNQDPNADDMLGPAQWQWLEESINADDNIDLYILGMGLQLVSFDKRIGEGWRLKPKSRARVFDLFERRRANRQAAVVFLSGDVHFAEADVTYRCHTPSDAAASSSEVVVTPFYEFTSSGLTHSVGGIVTDRVANVVLSHMLDEHASYAEQQNRAHSIRGWFPNMNFADVTIDWREKMLTVDIVDKENVPRLHYHLPFSALAQSTYRSEMALPSIISQRCQLEARREVEPPMYVIPGVPFILLCIGFVWVSAALVIGTIWHLCAKRTERIARAKAARELKKEEQEKSKKRSKKD